MAERESDQEITQIRAKLAALEAEQASLKRRLGGLLQAQQSVALIKGTYTWLRNSHRFMPAKFFAKNF